MAVLKAQRSKENLTRWPTISCRSFLHGKICEMVLKIIFSHKYPVNLNEKCILKLFEMKTASFKPI